MRGLSLTNKFLYFLNSIILFLLILSYLSPYISPLLFWPISFIGLLSPILYLISIIFLFYWIYGFKKPMWANIIILLIGSGNISNFIGTTPNNNSLKENIKIITYNVRLFNKYGWIKEKNIEKKTIKFFKTEKADILCLQEFYLNEKTPNIDYPFKHISMKGNNKRRNMAIYSKFPQIRKETISLKGEKINNTCIFSDILVINDTIRVFNIHLASNWFNSSDYSFMKNPKKDKIKQGITGIVERMKNSYKKRAKQVDIISENIKKSPYPVIICGDFNDTPLSYAYKTIKGELKDAFNISGKGVGNSFVKMPFLRIDYILHDKTLKSTNYKKYKQILSDHYAVGCEIIIP